MNSDDLKWCKDTLDKVMKMTIAKPFLEPVEGLPDYDELIKKKIDFSTIRRNLDNQKYSSIEKFMKDVNLIYENSKTYNGETILTFMASDILMEIMSMHSEKMQSRNNEWYQQLGKLSARIQKLMNSTPDRFLDNADWQRKELPLSNRNTENQQLIQLTGEKFLGKLVDNWQCYNADTKKAIYQKHINV